MLESEGFGTEVLRYGDVAVLLVDEDLVVRWRSPAAERLFGANLGPLPEMVDVDSASAVAGFLDRVAKADGQAVRTVCSVAVEGSNPRRVELVGRDLTDRPGIGGRVVVAHDVTGWVEREDAIRTRLLTDPLTGLGNRVNLMEHLQQAADGAAATGSRPALLFFDVDGFKAVNDRLGHHAGDQVLQSVAVTAFRTAKPGGSAYRMGGDEFVVLLDRVGEERALEMAEQLIGAIRQPMDIDGHSVTISASVGVTMVDPGRRPETILAEADVAMYQAKRAGRNQAVLFHPELRDWSVSRKEADDGLVQTVEKLRRDNQALLEAASMDFRTGLGTTAAFDADHTDLHAHHLQSKEPYCVLLIDIDGFHGYNARYRYLTGNKTLRLVAEAIRSTVRPVDRAYRWGGEEFSVLVPATTIEGATVMAERIRAQVQALGIEHAGSGYGVVTVTVGAVQAGPCHTNAEDVFEAANEALLRGKHSGRNRVVATSCPGH